MTKSERAEALDLYRRGATLDYLSEKFARNRRTVERLIERNCSQRGEHYTVTRRRLTESA